MTELPRIVWFCCDWYQPGWYQFDTSCYLVDTFVPRLLLLLHLSALLLWQRGRCVVCCKMPPDVGSSNFTRSCSIAFDTCWSQFMYWKSRLEQYWDRFHQYCNAPSWFSLVMWHFWCWLLRTWAHLEPFESKHIILCFEISFQSSLLYNRILHCLKEQPPLSRLQALASIHQAGNTTVLRNSTL